MPVRPRREAEARPTPKGTRGLIAFLLAGMGLLLFGPASCVVSGELRNHARDQALEARGKRLQGVVINSRGSGSALLVGAGWSDVRAGNATYRVGVTLREGTRVEVLHTPEEGSDRAEDVRARLEAWPFSRGNILIALYVGVPLAVLGAIGAWRRRSARPGRLSAPAAP